MTKDQKTKSAAEPELKPQSGASATENVRAAFDRYRQQMKGKGLGCESQIGASSNPVPMFPLGGLAGQPPGVTPWMALPAPPSGASAAQQAPFFESVGQMLRLGVSLASAVFAGGLQIMQGFNGPAMTPGPGPWAGCGGGECPPHGMCGCGGSPECACCQHPCGCHPGVHNCHC
jgi:hypothetical protein